MKATILISTSSFGNSDKRPLEMLQEHGVTYRLNPYGRKLKPEETVDLLRDCDGVIAGTEDLNREVITQSPRLKVISRCGTGLDNVDLQAAYEKQISVYNTPDALSDAVSELTLAGMLDILRRVSYSDRLIRSGEWEKPMGCLLRGKKVGIIGLGRVGKALARLLHPFEVTLVAYDPCHDDDFAREYSIEYSTLKNVLETADIVTLHPTFSSQLWHMLDEERLKSMKQGAILINCARGGLVDEEALYRLIESGYLGGAYLDTFEQEPYHGPLTESANVLMTPHIGSYASECRLKMEIQAVENLLSYFRE